MKYLFQFGIIAAVCFAAEMCYILLPLPVPASIYGLIILFLLLLTKVIKLEQVEGIADFFMVIMPILFISPSVSLITAIEVIKGNEIVLILAALFSTIVTMAITGVTAQFIIQRKKRKEESGNE